MQIKDEDFSIVFQPFNNISDCFGFYNTLLKNATSMHDDETYNNKEFKKVKKYIMTQMWANLDILGVQDKVIRKKIKELLKSIKNQKIETSSEEVESSSKEEQEETEDGSEQPPALTQGQEVKAIEDSKVSVENKEQSNEEDNNKK